MIYCNLKGGLGNMMFQIAATKAFALDRGVECSFPNMLKHLEFLDSDETHNPNLKHSLEYLPFFEGLNFSAPETQLPQFNYHFEFHHHQLPQDNFFVEGFFQSEKYFVRYREEILKMFEKLTTPTEELKQKYPFIFEQECISIHARRGDYVRHPNHHPPQSIEYFQKAISSFGDIDNLFVVFSDDIEWCKNNIKAKNIVYIENEKDYNEMCLMSNCRHHITTNSSFSWWGAWLNKHEQKSVIGPTKWFGPLIGCGTQDILPQTWLKI